MECVPIPMTKSILVTWLSENSAKLTKHMFATVGSLTPFEWH